MPPSVLLLMNKFVTLIGIIYTPNFHSEVSTIWKRSSEPNETDVLASVFVWSRMKYDHPAFQILLQLLCVFCKNPCPAVKLKDFCRQVFECISWLFLSDRLLTHIKAWFCGL